MDDNSHAIWRCPICETINNSAYCVVCGTERVMPEPRQQETFAAKPLTQTVSEKPAAAAPYRYSPPEKSGSGTGYDLKELSKSYTMRSLDELEDDGRKKDTTINDVLNERIDLRKLSKTYKMRSLDELEG